MAKTTAPNSSPWCYRSKLHTMLFSRTVLYKSGLGTAIIGWLGSAHNGAFGIHDVPSTSCHPHIFTVITFLSFL